MTDEKKSSNNNNNMMHENKSSNKFLMSLFAILLYWSIIHIFRKLQRNVNALSIAFWELCQMLVIGATSMWGKVSIVNIIITNFISLILEIWPSLSAYAFPLLDKGLPWWQ